METRGDLLQYLCVGVVLCNLTILTVAVNEPNDSYIGCYYNTNWTLSGLDQMVVTRRPVNNNTGCGFICYDAGFRYSGTQNGTTCMCGNYYGLMGIGICNVPCPGFPDEICGGRASASVYHTRKVCFAEAHDQILYDLNQPNTQLLRHPVTNLPIMMQYPIQTSKKGCELQCAADPACLHYSYFTSSHPDPLWVQRCFGFTIYSENTTWIVERGAVSGRFTPCYVERHDFPDDDDDYGGHLARTIIFAVLLCLSLAAWIHHESKFEKA